MTRASICSTRAPAVAKKVRRTSTPPDHAITISFGRNCRDKAPTQVTLTVRDLARRFATPDTTRGTLPLDEYLALDKSVKAEKAIRDREKDGEYFIPVSFTHAGTRSAKDVAQIYGFALDIDSGGLTESYIKAKLDGFIYIAYSSYSHHPSDPRWRVFVPYATPIMPAAHKKIYTFFQSNFDGLLDNRCETTSQLWYTPACPADAAKDFVFFVGEGVLFDPHAVQEVVAAPPAKQLLLPAPTVPLRSLSVAELGRVESALASIPSDDRQVWIKVGLALRRDVGAAAARELWLEWSKKSVKFDHADALATWDSLEPDDRESHVTLGTVFYLAKEYGWTDTMSAMPDGLKELNQTHFMAIDGGKTWVCRELFDPELNREYLDKLSSAAFRDFYSNQTVTVPYGDDTKKVNKAKAWLDHPARRSYHGITFVPGKPAPLGCYNLWRGFGVAPVAGDWSLLAQHISDVVCNGDAVCTEYLLNWMAFAVQHPDKPAEVAVVLQGARGAGKGKLANLFGELFGQHKLQIAQASHLTGNFNSHLRTCVFLFVDEALWAGDKAGESVLKALVTEPTISIEGKGLHLITVPNRLHIMMASNNEWVVPAGPKERRYFVLRVGDQHAQDHKYFAAIEKQMREHGGLEAMLYDLLQRDLTNFNIRQVPGTSGLDEQVLRSLEPGMQWWVDHLGQVMQPISWQFQVRSSLRQDFAGAYGQNSPHSKSSETKLGMFLTNVVPGGRPKRVQHAITGATPQECYEFPDQATCRQYLMTKLGLQRDPWL